MNRSTTLDQPLKPPCTMGELELRGLVDGPGRPSKPLGDIVCQHC